MIYNKLTIGGVEYSDDTNISITSTIGNNNSASSFSINFINYTGRHATSFGVGDEVIIYADKDIVPATTKIFTGVIEKISFDGKGLNEKLVITGRDFMSRLTDAMVEPEVYNNQEISVIVADLVNKYVLGVTVAGVTAPGGTIHAFGGGIGGNPTFDPTTKTVSRVTFSSVSVFDAIKFLAELSTSIFRVDEEKQIHFESKSQSDSGYTFDNTNITKSKFKTSLNDVYNRIFVYGDRQQVRAPQESFNANGGSVFTLAYKPHDTQVEYLGNIQTGGILNFAENLQSGTQYYVDYNSKQIVFVSGTDAGADFIPVSGGSVFVDYDRSVPLIKFSENRESVEKYGPRTKWVVDKEITDGDYAKEKTLNFLREHKDPVVQGTLTIKGIASLTAGEYATVNVPNHNINNESFDMLEVRYSFTKKNNQKDEVITVTLNKRDDNIVDTMKGIINDVRNLQSGDVSSEDLITRYETGTGSVGIRTSGLVVRTRTVTGSAGIYDNPAFGIYGTSKYAVGSNAFTPYTIRYSGGYV